MSRSVIIRQTMPAISADGFLAFTSLLISSAQYSAAAQSDGS